MLEGRAFVTGEAEIQSAYRSELSGIDGCLTLLEILVKVYNIQEGEVEIALDSQSALNQASESEYLCASQTSFDILQDIRGRLRQLPIDIKWKWVEGHQDEKGKKLDWWARQNQKVNLSAKDFVQNAIKYEYWKYRTPQLWYERWGLRINASKRSCISRKDVLSVLATKRMKSYWHNHREFLVLDATKIAWKEAMVAINGLPAGQQRWHIKFCTGFIGHNAMLYKQNEADTDNRKVCKDRCKETSTHIFHCKNERAIAFFEKKMKEWDEFLTIKVTSPEIQRCFKAALYHH